jgi:aldehyde dehydrogenase (NAD+)
VLLCYKVAAGLAAGCTIVAKPAPETPADAYILAECIEAAGIPPGVFNLVPAGRETGDYLIRHPGIDKISFTGSTAAGKHIAGVAAQRLARASFELGGKSAAVVLDDADIGHVLKSLVPYSMPITGQVCFSLTRVLVPESRKKEVLDAYVGAVKGVKVGDPFEADTNMGPLTMQRQLERVQGYIEKGKAEGAKLVTGGGRPKNLTRGYFVEPTVFADVDTKMTIAQEEIFGPVLVVIPYDDEDDAVRIANDNPYGLAGFVLGSDLERSQAVGRRLRAGTISLNGGVPVAADVPFGGYKDSGVGRQNGIAGFHQYLEVKSVAWPAG